MIMIPDPIIDFNIILCTVIAALSFCFFCNNKNRLLLYIGLAFVLFGFSHLLSLFVWRQQLTLPIFVLRLSAYALMIYVAVAMARRNCRC